MKMDNLIRLGILLIILYKLDFVVLANIIVASTIISELIIRIINKLMERGRKNEN